MNKENKNKSKKISKKIRAENETRTRDPNLGKVVLYQLSYFRILFQKARSVHKSCQGCHPYPISWGKVVLYQLSYFRN